MEEEAYPAGDPEHVRDGRPRGYSARMGEDHQQQTERRFVRSEDPNLSDEANAALLGDVS